MLLFTLVAAGLGFSATALVYAVRTAADGREDEEGFHYTGRQSLRPCNDIASATNASGARRTVISSGPAA